MYLPPSIPSSTCTCISLTLLTLPPTALLHHHYIPICTCLPVCLSACLRHATPRHTLLYSTRARATPDCLLRRPAWGIPSGSSLVWNFGRDTYTHYITRLPALGPHRERTLITSSCMYLLVGTYMLSIVEPPSTTPFITSFPSPHRAARRADGRHSTRKPSTTTPVRLVHLSHR